MYQFTITKYLWMESLQSNALIQELKLEFSACFDCPICKELFNDSDYIPIILPCSHSICKECAFNVLTKSQHVGIISCPYKCQASFKMDLDVSRKEDAIIHKLMEMTSFSSTSGRKITKENLLSLIKLIPDMNQRNFSNTSSVVYIKVELVRQYQKHAITYDLEYDDPYAHMIRPNYLLLKIMKFIHKHQIISSTPYASIPESPPLSIDLTSQMDDAPPPVNQRGKIPKLKSIHINSL